MHRRSNINQHSQHIPLFGSFPQGQKRRTLWRNIRLAQKTSSPIVRRRRRRRRGLAKTQEGSGTQSIIPQRLAKKTSAVNPFISAEVRANQRRIQQARRRVRDALVIPRPQSRRGQRPVAWHLHLPPRLAEVLERRGADSLPLDLDIPEEMSSESSGNTSRSGSSSSTPRHGMRSDGWGQEHSRFSGTPPLLESSEPDSQTSSSSDSIAQITDSRPSTSPDESMFPELGLSYSPGDLPNAEDLVPDRLASLDTINRALFIDGMNEQREIMEWGARVMRSSSENGADSGITSTPSEQSILGDHRSWREVSPLSQGLNDDVLASSSSSSLSSSGSDDEEFDGSSSPVYRLRRDSIDNNPAASMAPSYLLRRPRPNRPRPRFGINTGPGRARRPRTNQRRAQYNPPPYPVGQTGPMNSRSSRHFPPGRVTYYYRTNHLIVVGRPIQLEKDYDEYRRRTNH